jgi:hypothetical protein
MGHPPLVPRTHCKRGHEYTPLNTYIKSNGTRRCRECRTLSDERHNKRRYTHQRPTTTGVCGRGLHAWIEENWAIDADGGTHCKPCRVARMRERYVRHHVSCIVAGCRLISTNPKVEAYICPKHRANPPAWIFTAGLRIVGTEVLAA